MHPGHDYKKYRMSQMPSPYSDISHRTIIPSSWDELADMKKQNILEKVAVYLKDVNILRTQYLLKRPIRNFFTLNLLSTVPPQGSHTALVSFLFEEDTQRAEELGTAWYRSKADMETMYDDYRNRENITRKSVT